MEKIIIPILTIIIFLSCTERSLEIISEESMLTIQVIENITPPIQIIEGNTENETIQNQQLIVSNNRNQQEFNAYEFSHIIRNSVRMNNFRFAYAFSDYIGGEFSTAKPGMEHSIERRP